MDKTTTPSSKQSIRERLLAEHAEAAREREARDRRNLAHLVDFAAAEAKITEVDGWLADRTAKVELEAEARRARHREAAAKAVRALQAEGESVTTIAAKTGASRARVNEYLALGAGVDSGNGQVSHDLATAEPADNGQVLHDSAAAEEPADNWQGNAGKTQQAPAPPAEAR